ncbi:serine hydrolase [Aliikangiella sp. G2MR2-5]|uniref:serine hydrolase domain-containing protein n=1 Tax=Aliikangiella sp. G2MR2-5 TaxID=2788943 RepID=UPI0018A9E17B|nr:serine hydrolase domain-containing protein [Aliikangiella sp. G2MR2-5]
MNYLNRAKLHLFCLTILTLLLSFISLNTLANEQISEKKITRIEKYINQSMSKLELPGLAVGIIEDGSTKLLKGYGIRNSEGAPMTEDTSIELGSVSKSFTALAVMLLAEQGKFDIDKPVIDYIPWFQTQNKSMSDKIVLRHLLTHRSGFSSREGNLTLLNQDNSYDAYRNTVQQLTNIALIFEPGTEFQYSNINYEILGYLLELATGKRYEDAIEDIIFKPLSMTDSFVLAPKNSTTKVAQGFQFNFGHIEPSIVKQGRVTLAQGRLKVSARDMLTYLEQYMSGNDSFISAATKEAMFALPANNQQWGYGMGLYVSQKSDHRLIFHMGRSFGYETVMLFSPEKRFAMVALANAHSGFGNKNVGALLRGIGDIVLNKPPAEIDSPMVEKILFYSMFLLPLFILFFAGNFIRKYRQGFHPLANSSSKKIAVLTRLVIPGTVLLGLAYLVLVFLPGIYHMPLSVVALSEPTLYAGMLLCASVAILWFVIRSILILKPARMG